MTLRSYEDTPEGGVWDRRQRPFASVLPEEIIRQRALGWPDFHPEDFCHRCGRRNVTSWGADAEAWKVATRNRERGTADILCPSCFVVLHEQETGDWSHWHLTLEVHGE